MNPGNFTAPEDAEDGPVLDYDDLQHWDDGRLIEAYRRLSDDLRTRGFDAPTAHRMGRVEEELRARGVDPDPIAGAVDEAHR